MTGERPEERAGRRAGTKGAAEQAQGPVSRHHNATGPDVTRDTDTDEDAAIEAETVEQDIAVALEAARRERDEYLDMVRRVQADFENYKKRMLRQQTEQLERAAEGLVTRLLPVLDAFETARAHLEAEGSAEEKALLQAAGLLSDTLAKEGLERVDSAGAAFDPTVHDAVEHEPADDASPGEDAEEGGPVVSEVLRPGYRYKGKVVRPAMVRVRG